MQDVITRSIFKSNTARVNLELSFSLIMLYTQPVKINVYVLFLLSMLDTIVRVFYAD